MRHGPDGNRLTLDFSARHVDYGYDAASRLATVSNPLVTPNVPLLYAYSGDSQIASGCLDANASGVCDTGETTTTYPRDTAGRLSELLNAAGAGTLSDFVYTLDPLGNRTDAVETLTLPGQASLPSPNIYAAAAPQSGGGVLAEMSDQTSTPLLQPLLDALDAAYSSGGIDSASLYHELRGKVEEAQKAIDRGQCDTALNNLQAFLNDVDAQSGKGIDPSTADQLSTLATAAIGTLDCVPTATPTNTPEPSATPTATPTSTDTPTPTATSTPTATDTPTPTATAVATATPTSTSTVTASATSTPSKTATKTPTVTLTPTLTSSKTPKPTATPKPTSTPAPQSPGPSVKSAPLGPNTVLSGQSVTSHWHYQYDKLQRLTYACSDWNGTACVGSVFNYNYDGAGNLTSFDRWNGSAVETVHYKYNGANQIQCVDANNNNQCGDTGDIAYTYDAYGNLTNDGSSTYTYDAASRLISVVKSGVTTSYTYNGDGDRISQTVNGTLTTYVIDTATPLTMVLSETTGTATTYYWQGLDTLGQSDGTSAKYFEYDGLGSVRQLTDSSASVLLAQTFDPYGNGFSKAGTATSDLGWTGEQTDSNGFVFLRARYYNPPTGRFFQTDPSRKEQNAYGYSYSNPVNYTDPSGLDGLVSLPIVGDEMSGTVQWPDDWYGYKKHSFGGLQCTAACRRSLAVFLAQEWATRAPSSSLPWGDTGYFSNNPTSDQTKCEDCIRFVSYILWRTGFRMYGPNFDSGEPISFPAFPNGQNEGWTAAGVFGAGSGSSPAFREVQTFVDEWTTVTHRAELRGECNSKEACDSLLQQKLDLGDVVLYDYWYSPTWNHAAILTQKNPIKVSSRGNSSCTVPLAPDGTCPSQKWTCDSGAALADYLDKNETANNIFGSGLTKIGALHIDYEGYDPRSR